VSEQWNMLKTVATASGIAVILLLLIRTVDYRLFTGAISFEVYVGLVALLFTILGIWMGLRLTNRGAPLEDDTSSGGSVNIGEVIKVLGVSEREYEVLKLIEAGLSNKEIGRQLFISESTVKTHVSHLFEKLDAKRRTQVIQKAKELHLIV